MHDFSFTDESDKARSLYRNIDHTHDFKLRGVSYMTTQKKVDAGSPVGRLIFFEVLFFSFPYLDFFMPLLYLYYIFIIFIPYLYHIFILLYL